MSLKSTFSDFFNFCGVSHTSGYSGFVTSRENLHRHNPQCQNTTSGAVKSFVASSLTGVEHPKVCFSSGLDRNWEFRASKSPNFLKSSYSLWTPFKKNLLPTTPPSLDLQRPFLGGPRTVPQAVELPVVTTITDFCKSRLSSNIPCLTDWIMFISHEFGLILVTTGQNHSLDPC